MNSTNIKDVQKVEIEILDLFIDICKKYDIRYMVVGGTALGAIRNGGMIPWDDDIDVALPRKDFDRFVDIAKTEIKAPYFFQTSITDRTFKTQVRIRKNGTTAVQKKEWRAESHRGIFIDILPIDSVPSKEVDFQHEIGLIRSICTTKYIDAGLEFMKDDDSIFKMRRMYLVMEDVIRDYNDRYPKSDYVSHIVGYRCPENVGYKYPRYIADDTIEIPFKGARNSVKITKYYDEYLNIAYGNDWRVPKVGTSHSNLFTDAHNDVSKYDTLNKKDWDKLIDGER